MSLTKRAIEKNRVTAIVLVVVFLAGYGAFFSLPKQEDPGFVIRAAQVTTKFPGASPQRVELLVTDRLEKAIQEIPELDFIESRSMTGLSVITVNIKESYKDMRPIWDNLRRKVERETPFLPAGVADPVVNDEFGDVFGIIINLTGDGYSYAELKEIADEMRDELLRLPDAAKVDIYGVQDERIFIEYKDAKLKEIGLSPSQLSQILERQNIVVPGGSVFVGRERIFIEPSGNFESVADIENTVVSLPGTDAVVQLKDFVAVKRGYIDPPSSTVHTRRESQLLQSLSNVNFPSASPETTALALGISMRDGGQLTKLGKLVEDKLDTLRQAYPLGIHIELAIFQPKDVQDVIDGFTGSLVQAVTIVMLAVLLFLGVRTGIVVSALIPAAMVATLLTMQAFGITLNQMSLAALIIALGMLVDNGVVMAESTLVMMQQGKDVKTAAIDSAKELRIPLLTSSLTTAAAFLPIYLAESAVGEYCAALFQVVTIALLCSWLLSLTMTPLLSTLLLKPAKEIKPETFDSAFYKIYRRFLLLFLRHRTFAAILLVAAFVGAMSLFPRIPKLFFPASDRPTFEMVIEMVSGTAIESMDAKVRNLEDWILKTQMAEVDTDGEVAKEGILNWFGMVGQGAPRYYLAANPEPPDAAYSQFLVQHTSRDGMTATLDAISAHVRENFPELKIDLKPRVMGTPVKYPVEVRVSGKDNDTLFGLVGKVKAKLRSHPAVNNVGDDWGVRTKKVAINVDQARARRAGVSSHDVAVSLQAHFSGLQVTEYREEDETIPVTMRSHSAERHDLSKLETMNVFVQATGQTIPLRQIASGNVIWEPSKIMRRDRYRTVTINTTLRAGFLATDVMADLVPWMAESASSWPLGYRYAFGGENEKSSKANASIGAQLPIAGFIIIMLLVGQFNSFRRPLIIMATLPLALIGVVLGLLLAKSYFGFMTLLGVISLFGIVINNAIVLIDRIKIEIDENHLSPDQAVIAAAQQRLRPILLTTATTIVGLLPLWFGGSPMFVPMAIAIIFGLAFATVLTLGVVPLLYSVLFRVSFKDISA